MTASPHVLIVNVAITPGSRGDPVLLPPLSDRVKPAIRPLGTLGRIKPVSGSLAWSCLFLALPCSLSAQVVDSVEIGAAGDTSRILQERVPVYTVTSSDLESELGSQDISGILQSSRDVFANTAGLSWGPARFRIRGLDGENTSVLINGIVVNDPEAGWATWSQWGGLNDVTRYMEIRTGLSASRLVFAGIGGYSAINARASDQRRGTRISYALSNRAYDHRVMLTHSTGMMKNGWAVSASASWRYANEGYAEGTFFNAAAYFLSVEKKLNDRHRIGFTGFGAPIRQGRQGLAVQEAYDLTGNTYYNPFWGYQNGEKRNARVSYDHKPMAILTHYFTPDERTTWTTSLYYTAGRDAQTNINWFDAKDPRPDYYRYLPSFYAETDPAEAARLTEAWQNGSAGQIDWDQLYFANRKNLYTVQNADGIAGLNITGNRSKYIVEDQRNDPRRFGLNSVWSKALDDHTQLTASVGYHDHVTHNYRVVDDLLGGDFWVDVDQFADQVSADPAVAQNDLNRPNAVITVGERFGHDYDMHVRHATGFVQFERRWQQVEAYVSGMLGHQSFFREGFMVNGRFPDNSFGKSEVQGFLHYGLKAGAVYKLSGRQFVTLNGAYLTRPPLARWAYLSPRTRDAVVPGLTTEKVSSADLSYVVRFPRLKGRATVYWANIADQVWARSFFHDEYLTLVNYTMRGVDQRHTGAELGLEANVTSTLSVNAVLGTGRFVYSSRPQATITRDNSEEVFASDRTVYWTNYRVGGMPQTAASLGLRYNSPKFWFISLTANYFADIYLDPNPDRRTAEALDGLVVEDPQWNELLEQTKLDNAFTLDLFGGKSWMVQRKYRIALNVSVSNLLNNQDFVVGGFEQLRYERMDVDKFPPRLSYLFGRTYFAMLSIGF